MVSNYGVSWDRATSPISSWDADALNNHLHAIADWLEAQPVENVHVVFLDIYRQVIADEVMWTGDPTTSSIYPNEVLRRAIVLRASFIILMHNHPRGDATPSRQDLAITKQLETGARILGMVLLDHVVVARGGDRFSMRNHGNIRSDTTIPNSYISPDHYAHMSIAAIAARSNVYPQYGGLLQGQGWTLALALFRHAKGVTTKELPLMTQIPYTSVLRLVMAFADEGLARICEGPQKSRARSVTLTERGREVLTDIIIASS